MQHTYLVDTYLGNKHGIVEVLGPTLEFLTSPQGSGAEYSEQHGKLEWLNATRGYFAHVPRNAKHAFRNTAKEPVVQLITTTPKLGRVFQEVGRRVSAGVALPPPTQDDIVRFLKVADNYGYWNATPEENAAVGIHLAMENVSR